MVKAQFIAALEAKKATRKLPSTLPTYPLPPAHMAVRVHLAEESTASFVDSSSLLRTPSIVRPSHDAIAHRTPSCDSGSTPHRLYLHLRSPSLGVPTSELDGDSMRPCSTVADAHVLYDTASPEHNVPTRILSHSVDMRPLSPAAMVAFGLGSSSSAPSPVTTSKFTLPPLVKPKPKPPPPVLQDSSSMLPSIHKLVVVDAASFADGLLSAAASVHTIVDPRADAAVGNFPQAAIVKWKKKGQMKMKQKTRRKEQQQSADRDQSQARVDRRPLSDVDATPIQTIVHEDATAAGLIAVRALVEARPAAVDDAGVEPVPSSVVVVAPLVRRRPRTTPTFGDSSSSIVIPSASIAVPMTTPTPMPAVQIAAGSLVDDLSSD
jgi:hypothetical protein